MFSTGSGQGLNGILDALAEGLKGPRGQEGDQGRVQRGVQADDQGRQPEG